MTTYEITSYLKGRVKGSSIKVPLAKILKEGLCCKINPFSVCKQCGRGFCKRCDDAIYEEFQSTDGLHIICNKPTKEKDGYLCYWG